MPDTWLTASSPADRIAWDAALEEVDRRIRTMLIAAMMYRGITPPIVATNDTLRTLLAGEIYEQARKSRSL